MRADGLNLERKFACLDLVVNEIDAIFLVERKVLRNPEMTSFSVPKNRQPAG